MKTIGEVQTPYGRVSVNVLRYPLGKAIAVQLLGGEEMMEPFGTLSTNLPKAAAGLAQDEFFAKTWSENEPFVEPMLASGLFEDTGRRVPSGFVDAAVWRIRDAANLP